jgi:hypothetical protein
MMKKDMSDWMEVDENGHQPIPNKDGKIKWFVMSSEEDGGHYVGEYDMTDWDTAWEEVWAKAQEIAHDWLYTHEWVLLRGDHLIDLMRNVSNCLHDAGLFKEHWLPMDYWDEFDEGEE